MIQPLGVLLLFLASYLQEPPSGIYIVHTPGRKIKCENEAHMIINNSKICLAKKPIIQKEALEYATDIRYDPFYQMHYIDIGISSAASQILAKTVTSLPQTKFALALDGTVICTFSIPQDIAIRSFRIGDDIQFNDLTTIHNWLEKVEF